MLLMSLLSLSLLKKYWSNFSAATITHHIVSYLFPCKVRQFVSVQVTDVSMLRWLFHKEVNACRLVEGMWDVYYLSINDSAEAFLHSKVEGLDGDESGHNVHRDPQVLHCVKAITDVHCEGIITLKEIDAQISYGHTRNKPCTLNTPEKEVMFGLSLLTVCICERQWPARCDLSWQNK